jgi:hypothetical protein
MLLNMSEREFLGKTTVWIRELTLSVGRAVFRLGPGGKEKKRRRKVASLTLVRLQFLTADLEGNQTSVSSAIEPWLLPASLQGLPGLWPQSGPHRGLAPVLRVLTSWVD